MTYIKNFKKFLKNEEKDSTKVGANPQEVKEEEAVTDPIPNDPALKTQYDAINQKKNELLALEKQVVMKKDELSKLQTTYDTAASAKQQEEKQKAEAAAAAAPTT
jgi:hypothetical protein